MACREVRVFENGAGVDIFYTHVHDRTHRVPVVARAGPGHPSSWVGRAAEEVPSNLDGEIDLERHQLVRVDRQFPHRAGIRARHGHCDIELLVDACVLVSVRDAAGDPGERLGGA
jgi:hypothetical protein